MSARRRGLRCLLRSFVLMAAVLSTAIACGTDGATASYESDGEGDSKNSIVLQPVDGGTSFYGGFTDGLPESADFIPIGVWAESVVDDVDWQRDKAAGLNVYVAPTPNSDLAKIRQSGMYALPTVPDGGPLPTDDLAGFSSVDEVDMWAGAGNARWSGNYPGEGEICFPSTARCGFTILDTLTTPIPDDRMVYTNFGKGVAFWESDEQAARFVNGYQDVVSAEIYWFTDPNVCGASEGGALIGTGAPLPEATCRQASNYGATVDRVRSLADPSGSRVVWNFVEVGHPFKGDGRTITAAQIRAAVWSGFIHGARGVVYFNHSFGGGCASQHVLRDCDPATTAAVADVNAQIIELAPVLNAPFVENFATFDEKLDGTAKLVDGEFFVLVGSKVHGRQESEMRVRCGGAKTAQVLGESREIPIVDGAFSDTFDDGDAVHIYRLIGGDTCGLR